ncbi:hypothetical protein ACFVTT_23455 [Streptomyces niveus]|uniref:hypothetical protein n=1 Tax=Streptomyces niveus TaxID=193462 RepID=UPI003448E792
MTNLTDWDDLMVNLGLEPSTPKRQPKRRPSAITQCGTAAGWDRHYRRNEPPCDACRKAKNEARTKARRASGVGPLKIAECGTASAAHRHWRRGEPICEPCRVARAAALRAQRAAKKEAS